MLRSLREPLEDRVVTISRAERSVKLPADFQLLLAANPCPCGRLGAGSGGGGTLAPAEAPPAGSAGGVRSPPQPCFCSAEEIARHWRRLGSALLDRIELRVPIVPASPRALSGSGGESSAAVAERVRGAVDMQRRRFLGLDVRRNARLTPALLDRFCALDDRARAAFAVAAERLALSGRASHAVLRVARTIADLEGAASISARHVLEAVQHRRYGDDPFDILQEGRSIGMPSI